MIVEVTMDIPKIKVYYGELVKSYLITRLLDISSLATFSILSFSKKISVANN